jgi:hypothetical protein
MIINPKSYDKRLREDFSVEHHLEEYPLKFLGGRACLM